MSRPAHPRTRPILAPHRLAGSARGRYPWPPSGCAPAYVPAQTARDHPGPAPPPHPSAHRRDPPARRRQGSAHPCHRPLHRRHRPPTPPPPAARALPGAVPRPHGAASRPALPAHPCRTAAPARHGPAHALTPAASRPIHWKHARHQSPSRPHPTPARRLPSPARPSPSRRGRPAPASLASVNADLGLTQLGRFGFDPPLGAYESQYVGSNYWRVYVDFTTVLDAYYPNTPGWSTQLQIGFEAASRTAPYTNFSYTSPHYSSAHEYKPVNQNPTPWPYWPSGFPYYDDGCQASSQVPTANFGNGGTDYTSGVYSHP